MGTHIHVGTAIRRNALALLLLALVMLFNTAVLKVALPGTQRQETHRLQIAPPVQGRQDTLFLKEKIQTNADDRSGITSVLAPGTI